MPAWVVQAPRLQSEASAVHALGCVRRRALPRSAQAFGPCGEEVRDHGGYLGGRRPYRRAGSPLCSGMPLGEEGSAEHQHDGTPGDPCSTLDGGIARTLTRDARGGNKGLVRHRLSPIQVQQQALIRRLRTLEARRDWRGVLAAMVSERKGERELERVACAQDRTSKATVSRKPGVASVIGARKTPGPCRSLPVLLAHGLMLWCYEACQLQRSNMRNTT